MKTTLYELLGVGAGASEVEIDAAYIRRLGAIFDAGSEPGALGLVRQAYDILADRARRAAYDRSLASVALHASSLATSVEARRPPLRIWIGVAIALIAVTVWWQVGLDKSQQLPPAHTDFVPQAIAVVSTASPRAPAPRSPRRC
jgi:curved DNA-binding protein CbpA